MSYDPDKHHRHSIRLQGYDYTQQGAYFVTICTYSRECLFGEISDNGVMQLGEFGNVVAEAWLQTGIVRPYVELDEFVVMPNHFHGILVIMDANVGARRAVPLQPQPRAFSKPIAGSLSTIVGAFKSAVTKRINEVRNTPGAPLWQRNFHEEIIRNENHLNAIRQYILANPSQWALDTENPMNIKP